MKRAPAGSARPWNRRHLLGALLGALAGSALLGACGFELRRATQLPFRSIAVTGPAQLAAQVRRELRGQSNVKVLAAEEGVQGAEVVCEIANEKHSTNIAASTSGGTVRELTLSSTVSFRLRSAAGKELIEWTPLAQSRDISYNETAALAKENEQALLRRDMGNDIAQLIVRRIAFVKEL